MIIDRIRLAGPDAYASDDGALNLATSANHLGRSRPLDEGIRLDVQGIAVLLRSKDKDLRDLYARPDGPATPLLTITVQKEMFPKFFADPFANRVHTIAGFEDFQRGKLINLRPMEVEGKATLVSLDSGKCSWLSPAYKLTTPPQPADSAVGGAGVPIDSAAWELATTRLTPADGFSYKIQVQYWVDGQDPESDNPSTVTLAPSPGGGASALPSDIRSRSGLGLTNVIGYRVAFSANVKHETFLEESQYGPLDNRSLGRPLLRAVHLLEPIESIYRFSSIGELEGRCRQFSILELQPPLRALSAFVDLSAQLIEGEEIAVQVDPDVFDLCQARFDAEVCLRPPLIDKAMAG